MSNQNLKPVIQEIVNLPSRGMIYKNLPESFSIRPMTVNELKMLYGAGNTMAALSLILKSVIMQEDFPIDDLISADKLYLAFILRAITFGEEYKAKAYCPECKKFKDVSFSLIKDVKIDYLPDDFKNPRNIGILPVNGDELEIRLLISKDFDRIYNRAQKIRADFPEYIGDPVYPVTIASQIVSVNGIKMNSRDLEDYVTDLHAKDDLYINKKIKEIKIGPRLPIEIECPDCEYPLKVSVSIAEDFFRPELDF